MLFFAALFASLTPAWRQSFCFGPLQISRALGVQYCLHRFLRWFIRSRLAKK